MTAAADRATGAVPRDGSLVEVRGQRWVVAEPPVPERLAAFLDAVPKREATR